MYPKIPLGISLVNCTEKKKRFAGEHIPIRNVKELIKKVKEIISTVTHSDSAPHPTHTDSTSLTLRKQQIYLKQIRKNLRLDNHMTKKNTQP